LERFRHVVVEGPIGAGKTTLARRLAARLRFTEAVLEDLDAAVIACDAHGVVTVFNRTARALHGTDGAEVGPEGWIEEFDLEQIRAAGADEPGKLEELPLYRALLPELAGAGRLDRTWPGPYGSPRRRRARSQ